ncbi:hypothetical protein FHX48_000692 [Microbacterium halimionae]|uniref:Uncharacterized protein n=1 Tax=Microbacterium halimionae TaxID=1526413 RepID=A0A7W3PKM0_9MICO|nr:hypothetical protein [Microbacterium halimionae]NII95687.1 hypothetical protein [Microbacterium halimionae]
MSRREGLLLPNFVGPRKSHLVREMFAKVVSGRRGPATYIAPCGFVWPEKSYGAPLLTSDMGFRFNTCRKCRDLSDSTKPTYSDHVVSFNVTDLGKELDRWNRLQN